MRIGIDYTAAVEEEAGIGRFVRELTAALVAQTTDHHFLLLAPRSATPPDWVGSLPRVGWAPLPFSARLSAVLWQRLKLPLPIEWFTGAIDLFHATDYALPPLGRIPGVVTVHDLSFLRHPELAEPRLARYLAQVVPRALAQSTLVLADSEHTRQEVLASFDLPAEKVAVVYGGVSGSFQPIEDSGVLEETRVRYGLPGRYLFNLGRLEPRKNLPGLFRGYRLLLDRGQADMPLVIGGGKGWLYQPIFEAVEELGLRDRVRFLGHVPEADLPALLAGASAFIYPSYYEGFGLPPLEAMACGAPVVSSNTSSLPEVLGDAALLVSPDDSEALAEAVALVLSDDALRRDLRQRGLACARRFSWAAAARQLLAAYQRAVEPSKTPATL